MSLVDWIFPLHFRPAVSAYSSALIQLFVVLALLLFIKIQHLTLVDWIINVGIVITYKYTKCQPIYLKIVSIMAKKLEMGPTFPILITSNRRKWITHKESFQACPDRRTLVKAGFYLDLFRWGESSPPNSPSQWGGNCAYAFRDIFRNGKLKHVLQNLLQ